MNGKGAIGLAIIDTMTNSVEDDRDRLGLRRELCSPAPDRLVYAQAPAVVLPEGHVNVFTANASGRTQITHGGHSLNPVWGPRSIAFDREQLREARADLPDLADALGRKPARSRSPT